MEINISGSRLSPTTVDIIDDIDVFCVTNEGVHITHLQPDWNKKSYLQLRHQTELSLFIQQFQITSHSKCLNRWHRLYLRPHNLPLHPSLEHRFRRCRWRPSSPWSCSSRRRAQSTSSSGGNSTAACGRTRWAWTPQGLRRGQGRCGSCWIQSLKWFKHQQVVDSSEHTEPIQYFKTKKCTLYCFIFFLWSHIWLT